MTPKLFFGALRQAILLAILITLVAQASIWMLGKSVFGDLENVVVTFSSAFIAGFIAYLNRRGSE